MEHLIPKELFDEQHWLLLVVIAVGAMAVLVKGADWLVEGASGLAYRMGMPKVIVGATIVSLGTTSPECAVSVMGAWSGNPGLALGNAVGSIIADTGLIFGIGCLIVALPADRFVLSRQGWVQFGAALLLAVLCYTEFALHRSEAEIGRWVGIFFLLLLAGYLYLSVQWSRQHPDGEPFQTPEENAEAGAANVAAASASSTEATEATVLTLIRLIVIGLVLVVVASHVLIESVSELARRMGVPQTVIAATFVAFGTSLPELVVGITSIRKGHPELLVGNVIGADVLNVLFVIGASAAAAPLQIVEADAKLPEIFLYVHLPTMLLILMLFRVYIFTAVRKGHFSRWMGWPMVAIYVAYSIVQYVVSL